MFERLLELLLHAKSGVLAGLFIAGTTGALVTATTQNGVTTITITQPSPSASASPTASTTTQNTALNTTPNTTITFTTQVSSSSSNAESCSDEAHAMNAEVKRVNSAFVEDHTALAHMRKDARTSEQRDLLEQADKALKVDRQTFMKAAHESFVCGHDDEDKDEDTDEDKDDDDSATTTTTAVTTNVTTTAALTASTDLKTLADQAIAAMKLVVDNAKAKLQTLQTTTPKSDSNVRPDRAPRTPEPRKDGKRDEHGDRD